MDGWRGQTRKKKISRIIPIHKSSDHFHYRTLFIIFFPLTVTEQFYQPAKRKMMSYLCVSVFRSNAFLEKFIQKKRETQ
jgi:hypothetical protein